MPMIICVFFPEQSMTVRNIIFRGKCVILFTYVYNIEILIETETVSVDTVIITFLATDGDEPGTNNSRVFYYVDQRDDNQLFVLNSMTV